MGTTEDLHGRVKNVSLCGRLGRIIKVKIHKQKVPRSLKAPMELRFVRRMGLGEKQYMEKKVGRMQGENKSGLLQCLPKASLVISIATSTLKELIMQEI